MPAASALQIQSDNFPSLLTFYGVTKRSKHSSPSEFGPHLHFQPYLPPSQAPDYYPTTSVYLPSLKWALNNNPISSCKLCPLPIIPLQTFLWAWTIFNSILYSHSLTESSTEQAATNLYWMNYFSIFYPPEYQCIWGYSINAKLKIIPHQCEHNMVPFGIFLKTKQQAEDFLHEV